VVLSLNQEMITHFKNPVEVKMNFKKTTLLGIVLFVGGILALLISGVPVAHAENEDVRVLERKPDESNPMYEIIKVEGGLVFRAPKDMTFIKQSGVIAPISTEEYFLNKLEGVEKKIEVLSKRIDVLEENVGTASDRESQESL